MLELPSPCLVVMVGPAGSGKSSWAAEQLADQVVSSDALRALVGEGEHDLRASAAAFDLLDTIVEQRLKRRLTTVIDSLGNDAARRAQWRKLAADNGIPSIAVLLDVPPARVRKQNRARTPRVPDAVLARQLARWPQVIEDVLGEPFDQHHRMQVDERAGPVPAQLVSNRQVPKPKAGNASGATTDAAPARGLTFGLQIPQFGWDGGPAAMAAHLRDVVGRAESGGFESLWVMDHFRQIPMMGPAWADMLESWTTLAYLAACTKTLRVGTLVTGVTYRNVAHLGKIVATLDVLSGGRVNCGLGIGWYAEEHYGYGWEFPARGERYALLEDALQLLPRIWGAGNKPFDGAVLHVPDTTCYPRPLQQHIPIMVGGSGERRTLRLVAKYADACNLFGDPDTVAHKVSVLHQHCRDVGRDQSEISVSHLSTVLVGDDPTHVSALVESTRPPRVSAERHARSVNAGTVEQHARRIERFVAAGVDRVIVSLADLADPAAVDRYGAVIDSVTADPPGAVVARPSTR